MGLVTGFLTSSGGGGGSQDIQSVMDNGSTWIAGIDEFVIVGNIIAPNQNTSITYNSIEFNDDFLNQTIVSPFGVNMYTSIIPSVNFSIRSQTNGKFGVDDGSYINYFSFDFDNITSGDLVTFQHLFKDVPLSQPYPIFDFDLSSPLGASLTFTGGAYSPRNFFIDTVGTTTLNYNFTQLYDYLTGAESLDWSARDLTSSSGAKVLEWSNTLALYDYESQYSVDWDNRTLHNHTGTSFIKWADEIEGNVIHILETAATPSAPTIGFKLWVTTTGELRAIGSSGTVTTLALP